MSETRGRIRVGHFDLDDRVHVLSLRGAPLTLTRAQYEILRYFLQRAGEVVRPGELVAHVWGAEDIQSGPLIQVHVCNIRRVLGENGREPRYLRTIRGYGYMLVADGENGSPPQMARNEAVGGEPLAPRKRSGLSLGGFPNQWQVSHSDGVSVHQWDG